LALPKDRKSPAEIPDRLHGVPVLVVDDSATNRRILNETLLSWRMKPSSVEGGPAALAALERAREAGAPFQAALIDAQMPGMDGFELASKIHSQPQLARTTVIMLTSAGQAGQSARGRSRIQAYLTKPVKQSELFDLLMTLLGSTGSERARDSSAKGPTIRTKPIRVLLAEDIAVNRRLAMRMLQERGHKVAVAANGREALAALEKSRFQGFDLVLMDIQMPEMGGFEATAAIRQREKALGRHIPIVALTADAMKGDRERCLEAGMDAYLSKPIRAEELLAVIETLVPEPLRRATAPAKPHARNGFSDQVVDEDALLSHFRNDRKLLKEIIKLFRADCPRMLAKIQRAIAQKDKEALRSTAHAIKGSAANFLAEKAVQAALHLETLGRGDSLTGARAGYAALKKEIERLDRALLRIAQKSYPRRAGNKERAAAHARRRS